MSFHRDPETICSISSFAVTHTTFLQIWTFQNYLFSLSIEMSMALIVYYFIKWFKKFDMETIPLWRKRIYDKYKIEDNMENVIKWFVTGGAWVLFGLICYYVAQYGSGWPLIALSGAACTGMTIARTKKWW